MVFLKYFNDVFENWRSLFVPWRLNFLQQQWERGSKSTGFRSESSQGSAWQHALLACCSNRWYVAQLTTSTGILESEQQFAWLYFFWKWQLFFPLFCCLASGSVFWYFVLLNYVKEEDLAGCSTACASLLTAISRQLQDRLTPLEALLQTRCDCSTAPFSSSQCTTIKQVCKIRGV